MSFKMRWFRFVKKILVWLARKMSNSGMVWMLHECVTDISYADNVQFAISVEAFERLVQRKICENYRFCDLKDISDGTKKSIYVTFDDGRDCIYKEALPILEKYQIPFCVFVITGKVGKPGYLSEEEIKSLAKCQLCTLGTHTVSHVKLRECSTEMVRNEVMESKRELEKMVNCEIKYFAYPYGDIQATSWKSVRIVRKSHYCMAFSTLQCHISKLFIWHKFFIPRVNINEMYANLHG